MGDDSSFPRHKCWVFFFFFFLFSQSLQPNVTFYLRGERCVAALIQLADSWRAAAGRKAQSCVTLGYRQPDNILVILPLFLVLFKILNYT